MASWLRAAAGTAGLREVARRALGRLHGVPSTREAALVLDDLGAGNELGGAGRSALEAIRPVAGTNCIEELVEPGNPVFAI